MSIVEITPQPFCDKCNFICRKKSDWDRHIKTAKHLLQKTSDKHECEKCNYYTTNLYDWNRHVKTKRHLNDSNQKTYECITCDKQFANYRTHWYHKKTCVQLTPPNDDMKVLKELVKDLVISNHDILKQNQELQKQVTELAKSNNTVINNNNNTTTNNNQKFNINLFLNETCKDAINFSDFIKNIQITYEDLENNAQLGFVNGISKIFLDNLKQLDINERPIHCTDVKRETMYIKDENTWTKQPDDEKLQKAIQTVSYRSMGKLAEWKQENPDYKDCNSEFSQKCLDIQRQTLAGSDRPVYYPKVIHALARETIVDK
jgi:hypothetical protein